MIMSKQFLLPHKFKYLGLALFLLGAVGFFAGGDSPRWMEVNNFPVFLVHELFGTWRFFQLQTVNLAFTITFLLLVGGALFIAFAKEKIEDEFINSLRLRAFQYSVLVNSLILLLALLLVWEIAFIIVLIVNQFSTLFLFVLIFHILLWKNSKKEAKNEK